MKYIVNEKLQIPVDHTKFTAILKVSNLARVQKNVPVLPSKTSFI